MSRPGMDRETFVKGQLEAVHKSLTKYEMPLKPKHARRLIVGTHQERSSAVFWNAVSRVQLEKNPVLTWKFCHLLHKLMRDGHRKVPDESHRYISRIKQLGQFWKHLNTSGYGICNETYCKLLIERLEFHRKFPVMPGSLIVNESQLKTLESDLDNSFEMTISMLDEMDNLLNLQQKGQCLLAPLIIVILDTSKLYDYLVKMIFQLHSQLPRDALEGHRTRFREVFGRTKKFYEDASNLQYFKYLVSIPTLPQMAPNFLQASDLDDYRTPHAYLHSEGEEAQEDQSNECTLLDLTTAGSDDASVSQPSPNENDIREEQMIQLTRALEDERFAKQRLIEEVRSRIEQYENRLQQMQNEVDHSKGEMEEARTEAQRIGGELAARKASEVQSNDALVKEAEARATGAEERFSKMKGVYEKFRSEHVTALTKLGELQRQLEESEKIRRDKEEEMLNLQREIEERGRDASRDASAADELRTQLAMADVELERLKQELENDRATHKNELQQSSDAHMDETSSLEKKLNESVSTGILAMLDRCEEELQNATSISYPRHLAQSLASSLESQLTGEILPVTGLISSGYSLAQTVVACAAAAYTASIQHFDPVNEKCDQVLSTARRAYGGDAVAMRLLKVEVQALTALMTALPAQTDIDKDAVGNELETEMKRMDEAIRQAVNAIEQIQRKARENNHGVQLEVNEAILATCQALMSAIMRLVAASRELQLEIVALGRGGASPSEFYKRNHQWTEGLLSASKAVGVAARVLVSAADGVVTGNGKLEELIVAAQEIAASTAQLFVSSRVKADRDSEKLGVLSTVSKEVNQCTAQVVASVKSGQTTLCDQDVLDFSNLSLHQAKKEEMESQVRTLELEQALNTERARLRELRKQHYHMAGLVAGNNKDNSDTSFEMIG